MISDLPGRLPEIESEAHHWLMRFAAGNADATALEAFKQWSSRDPEHAAAFARACHLWELLRPAAGVSRDFATHELATSRPVLGRRSFIGGAIAASVAAATYCTVRPPLDLWPSLSELAADYRTGVGEQRNITLADGPSVELNTRTSIALRASTSGSARIELIAGEMAITVRPELARAVEVIAARGHVAATDSVFNLRCEGASVCATCVSGVIEVSHGGHSARLESRQQIVYSSDGLGAVSAIDVATVTGWTEGVLVFHATPLSDAVAEINRYRSGRIILTSAALGRRLFNARFKIDHVEQIVAQIQQVFGASVTTFPGGVVLIG